MNDRRSIGQLVRLAQPQAPEERLLRQFSELLNNHPDMVSRVIALIEQRLSENRAASVHEATERARWDYRVQVNDDLVPLLARGILYVRPQLNGLIETRPSRFDAVFGIRRAEKKLRDEHARRLEWADGSPLTEPHPALRGGAQSAGRKPVQSVPVRPLQSELFSEARSEEAA